MNITKPAIVIKLGEGDESAVLTFSQLKNNVRQKLAYDFRGMQSADTDDFSRLEHMHSYQDAVLKTCIAVENLAEDGQAVTVQAVKDGALYPETINQVLIGYFAAIAEAEKRTEEQEKKEPSSGV